MKPRTRIPFEGGMTMKPMDRQTWHKPLTETLAFIASPSFSHGRANYTSWGWDIYLYQRDSKSPTGVTLWGSSPALEPLHNWRRCG